mmetsp:Transcript_3606/g.5312  ORF Transcript_3606/g.5312 Transcript_3606/m.5312 type:complete len:682 (+) Transcript_3606:225-2270(+)
MIKEAEKLKFYTLEEEYPEDYRSNKRLLIFNETLANVIYERILPHFTSKELAHVRPMGFDNKGVWTPYGCNEALRINKYDEGDEFKEHIDGLYIPFDNASSIFSIIICLNDDYEGGDFVINQQENYKKYMKKGSAIVFKAAEKHQALKIKKGSKYILRTDVMFRRSNTYTQQDFMKLPKYKSMVKTYYEAIDYGNQKNAEKYTERYREALDYQYKYYLETLEKEETIELILPEDLLFIVSQYLTVADLGFLLSQNIESIYRTIFRQPQIWKHLYMRDFPDKTIQSHYCAEVFDWYLLYKKRSVGTECLTTFLYSAGMVYTKLSTSNFISHVEAVCASSSRRCTWFQRDINTNTVCGLANIGRALKMQNKRYYIDYLREKGAFKYDRGINSLRLVFASGMQMCLPPSHLYPNYYKSKTVNELFYNGHSISNESMKALYLDSPLFDVQDESSSRTLQERLFKHSFKNFDFHSVDLEKLLASHFQLTTFNIGLLSRDACIKEKHVALSFHFKTKLTEYNQEKIYEDDERCQDVESIAEILFQADWACQYGKTKVPTTVIIIDEDQFKADDMLSKKQLAVDAKLPGFKKAEIKEEEYYFVHYITPEDADYTLDDDPKKRINLSDPTYDLEHRTYYAPYNRIPSSVLWKALQRYKLEFLEENKKHQFIFLTFKDIIELTEMKGLMV